MERPQLDTQQKALQLNLDESKYGTLAEIGAGQEVANWLFRAGRAAGTIAKTISAYDMAVSDAIYGHSHRYVSRERLLAMLEHEYSLLLERLSERRGEKTCFFAFADTVATRGLTRDEGDGWMGIRFQHEPGAPPSDILVHVGMREKVRLHEQQALGILGINLVYAAFHGRADIGALAASLLDGLSRDRIEIDVMRLSGPAFAGADNRLVSLTLVEQRLTDAAMFTVDGEVVQPSEVLYKRPVLIERGRFCPPTLVTVDIFERAREAFLADGASAAEPVMLFEMTLADRSGEREITHADFLARVDALRGLGKMVLVSRYVRYFRLVEYLSRYTQERIGLALGLPSLQRLAQEEHYDDLPGGLLEALGRVFRRNVRAYVYPYEEPATGRRVTIRTVELDPRSRPLVAFLLDGGAVVPIEPSDPAYLRIHADEILAQLRDGDARWEDGVPQVVAEAIKRERLFGARGPMG